MIRGLSLFLIALILFVLGVVQNESVIYLIDPATVLFVAGGTVIFLFISFTAKDLAEALDFIFSSDNAIPVNKYNLLSRLYQAAGEYFLLTGLMATYIGAIILFDYYKEYSHLGDKMSLILISFVYCIAGRLFAALLERKLKMCDLTDQDYTLRRHNPARAMTISFLLFVAVSGVDLSQTAPFRSLISFINPTSLILVIGGSVFVALLCAPPWTYIDSLAYVFSTGEVSKEKSNDALKAFNQLRDSVVSMVILVYFVALILLVSENFNLEIFSEKLTIMLVSVFYGILFICFVQGLANIVNRKLLSINDKVSLKPAFSTNFIFIFCVSTFFLIGMVYFLVMFDFASLIAA